MRKATVTTILLVSMIYIAAAGPENMGTLFGTVQGSHGTEQSAVDGITGKSMVYIKGGTFLMGYENGYPDEMPVHDVKLGSYYIDRYEVTNRQFKEFVGATGYTTSAEKDGYCWAYLEGADNFQALKSADWKHPQGPESSIDDKMDHPVVCVSWYDASAYAHWAGKRLPTEAEWEYAARAGFEGHFNAAVEAENRYGTNALDVHTSAHSNHEHSVLINDGSPSSKSHGTFHSSRRNAKGEMPMKANYWQGSWPELNKLEDAYFYTSPVGSFKANNWGVNDMIGNVWEWTVDWYDAGYYEHSPLENPEGAGSGERRVARGGSWFCSPNYCGAYSTHYRGASPPDHAFNNVGFRCAADIGGKIGHKNRKDK